MDVKCPRCKNHFFSTAGGHAVMDYRGRQSAMQHVLLIGCERCDHEWQPDQSGLRAAGLADLPTVRRELADSLAEAVTICCPKCADPDGSPKVLAVRCGEFAVLNYSRRVIVAHRLFYVSCDKCSKGVHVSDPVAFEERHYSARNVAAVPGARVLAGAAV